MLDGYRLASSCRCVVSVSLWVVKLHAFSSRPSISKSHVFLFVDIIMLLCFALSHVTHALLQLLAPSLAVHSLRLSHGLPNSLPAVKDRGCGQKDTGEALPPYESLIKASRPNQFQLARS